MHPSASTIDLFLQANAGATFTIRHEVLGSHSLVDPTEVADAFGDQADAGREIVWTEGNALIARTEQRDLILRCTARGVICSPLVTIGRTS